MLRTVACALLLVLASGCGAVRHAAKEQRWFDACQKAADATRAPAPWSDLDSAGLGEELRMARGGALKVRVLPPGELEAVVGPGRLAPFDESFGVLELSSDVAQPANLAFDVQFASVRVARTLGDDLALYHEYRRVLRLPPPPRARVETKANPVKAAVGIVGLVTLVTPLVSVISGRDEVSPLLAPDENVIEPTRDDWTKWHADPALDAARKLQTFLRERDGQCDANGRCVLRALIIGPERNTFDVAALRVRLRYLTQSASGASCAVDARVLVRLPKAEAVVAQLKKAFPEQGLPLATMESAHAGGVTRWWSGTPDAERVTRESGD